MHVVSLVLEAPLMSFGRVAVDERRPTATLPYKSMVVGIVANAMGLRRTDPVRIQTIDDAIEIASRIDRAGRLVEDYHTVYLGTGNPANDDRPSFVAQSMWSSLGRIQGRSFDGTLLTDREYLSDGCVTVVIGTEDLVLAGEIADACQRPQRPIFVGRKSCLVSRPVFHDAAERDGLFDGLVAVPVQDEDLGYVPGHAEREVQWPAHLPAPVNAYRQERVTDLRDWSTGQHVGSRSVRRGVHTFRKGVIE